MQGPVREHAAFLPVRKTSRHALYCTRSQRQALIPFEQLQQRLREWCDKSKARQVLHNTLGVNAYLENAHDCLSAFDSGQEGVRAESARQLSAQLSRINSPCEFKSPSEIIFLRV